MRPESFDADLQEEWSRWVLDHGLPELPGPDLVGRQSVPVSYWIGPETAAVLHIRRGHWDDEEDTTEIDVQLFLLNNDVWDFSGSGGAGPVDDPPLGRVQVPPRHVALDGLQWGGNPSGGPGVKAIWGELGTEAAVIEVRQGGRLTRRPVEAPIGLLVVSAHLAHPFTARVLDPRGQLLAEIERPAGDEFH